LNLQTHVSGEMWNAIANSYEAGNYTHAILEAIHALTNVLRDRSGAEGDGAVVVGQAIGGDNPKLRINALQSETEKSIQRGMEQLLRGVYLAIRNPRSHEQHIDKKDDADAIILFLDYILRILNASKESFTIAGFMASLEDTEFVESKRYAELLVAEIPANKRGDALLAIFDNRLSIDFARRKHIVPALRALLSEPQTGQFLSRVSDVLRTTTEDAEIRTTLQMLSPELWPNISEAARIRIENKMIRDIAEGEVLAGGKTFAGSLGTWSKQFVKNFTLRAEAANTIISKLEDADPDDRRYLAKFFITSIPEILTEEGERRRAIRAIATAIRNDDVSMREALINYVRYYPTKWQNELAESLSDLADPNNPAVILPEAGPFLSAPTVPEITDEDIPF